MKEQLYESEDLLQRLLSDYPDLLAGSQIDSTEPRKWVLVSREIGVPSEESGGSRWSIDHLFLDQSGIPTFVEVKRSSDTRIRREVVGQMLDYAANAVVYWPVEEIRERFAARCERDELDPDEELEEHLGVTDAEVFWQGVQTNLRSGCVRLLFVADEIPVELRRIIEFLNVQMDPAEVLAVEVKQYTGSGQQALVPRIIGQTEQARRSMARNRQGWATETAVAAMQSAFDERQLDVLEKILSWISSRPELSTSVLPSRPEANFYVNFRYENVRHQIFSVWREYERVLIEFQRIARNPPFEREILRREWADKLNAIPGVNIPGDQLKKHPGIPLATLAQNQNLQQFFEVVDWVIEQIRTEYTV